MFAMPGLNKPSHHKHAQRKWKQTRWLITIFIIPFICYRQVTILRKLGSFGDYGFDVTLPINPEAYNLSNFWAEQSTSCFRVDNICHGNHTWFYDSNRRTNDQSSLTYTQNQRYGSNYPDLRIYFNVSSYNEHTCTYSSTPYHVVAQTLHNNMMGEFYKRYLPGMNQIMRKYPARSEEDVQLYLHFFEEGKSRIEHGHHLFLNGLTQHYKTDTFLSLVEDSSCQCFEKLAFCGYVTDREERITDGNVTENNRFFHVGPIIDNLWSNSTTLPSLREDLLEVYRKDQSIEQKVHERRRTIIQNGIGDRKMIDDVDEWKIIGLMDRKYRRVWLNIDDAIETCRKFFLHKVICIKLNVEDADSSEEQLIMHASVNSTIGVHGSQYANAVFLRRRSTMLELLPFIKHLVSRELSLLFLVHLDVMYINLHSHRFPYSRV